jgi:predicted ester cyclase
MFLPLRANCQVARKKTLQAFLTEVWNNEDFTNLEDFLAPKYEIRRDPVDPWDGKALDVDEFKARVLYSRKAFPDLHFNMQEMILEPLR